jgi:hypothetical protein
MTVKRKARHRYVHIVELYCVDVRIGVSKRAFLGYKDAVAWGKQLITRGKCETFQVHKLPLLSERE